MKRAGIIGGIGPQSTLDYYKEIVNGYRQRSASDDYPHILINSINMTRMLRLVEDNNYTELTGFLVTEIDNLKHAGADFALIASNTPHVVFDEVNRRSPIPLLSIVEATVNKAVSSRLSRLLLIGTMFTMKSGFYTDCMLRHGIEVFVPSEDDQKIIHDIIFHELEEGIVTSESKNRLLGICNDLVDRNKIDGIILGCTELPLMIKKDDFGIEVLNTTHIHIEAVLNILLDQ